jgi:hypothetical protein
MNARLLAATTLATALVFATPSSANDSSAAIGLGGLELTRNDAISMDSEELYLSRDKVTVKYRFTNNSADDVETLVSFPLPPIPRQTDGYLGEIDYPDWSQHLNFKTLVDGQPVRLETREEVSLMNRPDGKNVEARLAQVGWPVHYWQDPEFWTTLDALSPAKRQAYIAEGLLRVPEYDGEAIEPNWQVTTHITRTQNFPAGKTVTVEHSYKPVAGGSVGGALVPEYRKTGGEYLQDYMQRYCMDKPFLAGFDKQFNARQKAAKAKGDEFGNVPYVEHWLSYVLKSGANWKGPIKDFRLVVDKGTAGNLVSFCMDGVKKIAPTQFEVRRTNFEPAQDLDILIVEFYDGSGE